MADSIEIAMIKYELPALAKKLDGILKRDVNRCVKVAGTRPAFYFVEKSYSPALYVVLYQDRPGEVAELSKKSFDAAFMTYAPAGLPKILAVFDSMPDFGMWRDGLGR